MTIPKYWETAVRAYGFLSQSPAKLAECPSARETNRKLTEYGHNTESNPVALLWDNSPNYRCWRFFGIRHGSPELIRFKVPLVCDPTRTSVLGFSMRDHPDFRIPTFEDFCELHERHESEGETKMALQRIRAKREHDKRKQQEQLYDDSVAAAEDLVIEIQSKPIREVSVPVTKPIKGAKLGQRRTKNTLKAANRNA